jgi:hypothetical protein
MYLLGLFSLAFGPYPRPCYFLFSYPPDPDLSGIHLYLRLCLHLHLLDPYPSYHCQPSLSDPDLVPPLLLFAPACPSLMSAQWARRPSASLRDRSPRPSRPSLAHPPMPPHPPLLQQARSRRFLRSLASILLAECLSDSAE